MQGGKQFPVIRFQVEDASFELLVSSSQYKLLPNGEEAPAIINITGLGPKENLSPKNSLLAMDF